MCQAWPLLADHELMFHDLDAGLIVLDVATGARSVILSSNKIVSPVFPRLCCISVCRGNTVPGSSDCLRTGCLYFWSMIGNRSDFQAFTGQFGSLMEFQDQNFLLTNYTFKWLMICRLIDFPSPQISQLSAWAMGEIIWYLSTFSISFPLADLPGILQTWQVSR